MLVVCSSNSLRDAPLHKMHSNEAGSAGDDHPGVRTQRQPDPLATSAAPLHFIIFQTREPHPRGASISPFIIQQMLVPMVREGRDAIQGPVGGISVT